MREGLTTVWAEIQYCIETMGAELVQIKPAALTPVLISRMLQWKRLQNRFDKGGLSVGVGKLQNTTRVPSRLGSLAGKNR